MLFIFDENYSYRIAEGLNLLEGGNQKSPIPVTATHILSLTNGKTGEPDEVVIKIAGANKGIIFTKDKDFKQIKSVAPLYKAYKVGVVFLKQNKKGLSYWDNLKILVEKWEDLKSTLSKDTPPFVYQLSNEGVQRFQF
jgi:predicted nuclease of predicted toxin-antitoxin system